GLDAAMNKYNGVIS
ncbi:MAG: hypothetical protein CO064_11730, partial [Anaerolineae bacterium CG_4_9_14_0_8_um_filter_58_9]